MGVTIDREAHRRSGVDVIMRFHDPSRLADLDRAVFSLLGQHHRPLRILLVTQRFSPAQQDTVRAALTPMLSLADGIELVLLNFTGEVPRDARSKLVNLGMTALCGRYLAFLDCDDVLLPPAYRRLIGRLQATDAAIAFAQTPVVKTDRYDGFLHPVEKTRPFEGYGLGDLLVANFCPIHSYLIDRDRVSPTLLSFSGNLTAEEDYEFLLRICAASTSDFALLGLDVGLYLQETDRSHTPNPQAERRATRSRKFVDIRRRMTVLTPQVQRTIGIEVPTPDFTVQDWIDFTLKKGQAAL